MSKIQAIPVPDVGGDAVEVIEICVQVGDVVEPETALITIESDKASMDIPAPEAGKITAIKTNLGDKVTEGTIIVEMEITSIAEMDIASDTATAPMVEESLVPKQAVTEKPVAAVTSTQNLDVVVPSLGDDNLVEIIEVLVSVGDQISVEQGLITLETDKATMDVPSPEAGVLQELLVKTGEKVQQGTLIARLQVTENTTVTTTADNSALTDAVATSVNGQITDVVTSNEPAMAERNKPAPVPHHPHAGEIVNAGNVYASPAVRRMAKELGADLHKVTGTGRKKRVLKQDVQAYIKYELSRPKATPANAIGSGQGGLQLIPTPNVDFSQFGEIEQIPLTRIQKLSGPNLHRNWVMIPHVTQFDEADITELETFRKQQNALNAKQKQAIKLTPLVFIMKAVAKSLAAIPVFNSSLAEDGEHLILKKYIHLGIAVDTPNGLIVPVIKDVDKKGIMTISEELNTVSAKAREGKLGPSDLKGACFTISSLGGIGGTAFTPIINAPDVAILGVSKSEIKPKWQEDEFVPRLMLPLSLSYDHRVIDGAVAARFIVNLSQNLADIRRLIL